MADSIIFLATKEQLLKVDVPVQTRSYRPVEYKKLIETTLEGIEREGFVLRSEKYLKAKDGKQATGRYGLAFGNDPEMGLQVVWQNSYDKSVSLKIAIGAEVFVCSNGCCYGDVGAYKKKHVGEVQVIAPKTIAEYLHMAGENFERKIMMKEHMKEIELSKRTCAELIGRMYIEKALINGTQLNIMKRQIEMPEFDYNAKGSLWELYQHGTRSIRDSHPADWLQKHINMDSFFVKEYGLDDVYTKMLN